MQNLMQQPSAPFRGLMLFDDDVCADIEAEAIAETLQRETDQHCQMPLLGKRITYYGVGSPYRLD